MYAYRIDILERNLYGLGSILNMYLVGNEGIYVYGYNKLTFYLSLAHPTFQKNMPTKHFAVDDDLVMFIGFTIYRLGTKTAIEQAFNFL